MRESSKLMLSENSKSELVQTRAEKRGKTHKEETEEDKTSKKEREGGQKKDIWMQWRRTQKLLG